MSFEPRDYLRHMLEEADFLVIETRKLTKQEFLDDKILRRAFVRSIEVIGEAAKQVPADFRAKYPDVAWRVIAGMRDKLIHGYFAIDYNIVWDTATNEAAILKDQLQQILRQNAEGGA